MRKQTVKTSRVAAQLEKMFRLLNEHFYNGQLPEVAPAMAGIAAGAAGMVIGTALKMAGKLKLAPEAIALLLLATFCAAWLRLPLPIIVLALAPLSIAASLWRAGLILRKATS